MKYAYYIHACVQTLLVGKRHTPLLILMHDVIILTQNEAMGARSPSLAVAAPIASF